MSILHYLFNIFFSKFQFYTVFLIHVFLGANLVHLGASLVHLGANLAHLGDNMAHLGANSADLGAILADLGAILAHLGANLAHLGASLADLGANMAHLGANLVHLGANLAPVWPILTPTWPILGPSWYQLGRSWRQFGPSWRQLGRSWRQIGPSWVHLGGLKGLGRQPHVGSLKVKGEQLVLLTSGRSMVFGDRASSMTKAVIVRWQCRKKPRESTRETPKEDQRRETLYIQTPDQPLSRPHIILYTNIPICNTLI